MPSDGFSSAAPWWAPALTLAERAAAARGGARNQRVEHATGASDGTAQRRLDRWRRQRPFDRPEYLARRLEVDSLTEREFAAILEGSPASVAEWRETAPRWVSRVDQSNAAAEVIARMHAGAPVGEDPSGLAPARAFVEPFVVPAMASLYQAARAAREAHPEAPFDAEHATRLFEPSLWTELLTRAAKVVVLELNVARVQGALAGDTPELRFADFARRLRDTGLRQRILEEYPVLARSLALAGERWAACAAEFLHHLAGDAERLRDTFAAGAHLGTLQELTVGAGDVHRNGHSVVVAAFSSGARVVYKPRSLAVDVHFEHLLQWANGHGQSPPLRAVRTIDAGDHGWAEFVRHAPCASAAEVARFYERFGAYLALLHVLEATDFHYENVIASGEHPMLVDLEALFHPRAPTPDRPDEPEWLGWMALQSSVLRAGVLPYRSFASEQSSGVDLSAVGGAGGQRTPSRQPMLAAAGTDEMHLVRDYGVLPASRNRPALGAHDADPARYAGRIVDGFTATYRLLMRHRAELLAPGGPIHRFADAQIRVVLRPTHHYALILAESYHPDVLRDAVERDRLIDRLWVAVPGRPELERIIRWEHADLVAGDVPLFTSRPGGRDLHTTHGVCLADFFERSGLDAATERIASLSEADLVRQQWVVTASLVALAPGGHQNTAPAIAHASRAAERTAPSADACIDAARRVANRIASLALRRGELAGWLGLTLARERDWIIQPVGTDLYGGTLGIAFFLAYAADVTSDREHHQLARTVAGQVARRLRAAPDPTMTPVPGSLGAFGALGGAVYVLSHLALLWNDSALLDVAEAVVSQAGAGVDDDRQLDIVGGAAGLIAALAALNVARRSEAARGVMRACAERLLAAAVPAGPGIAWTTTLASWQPLAGFSHGASGMAHALIVAGAELGERRFTDAALAALAYERSTFDPVRGNWPDFRILGDGPRPAGAPVMWAWCHGAPGIGVARLAALARLHDAEPARVHHTELARDLDAALESTVRYGFGANDSLCHGDLGNLELLLRARELGRGGEWERALAGESARLVARIGRGDWRCGIPGAVETPGLMMGLAGIGYGLLRLGAPHRVPSLLSLEPPRRASHGREVR